MSHKFLTGLRSGFRAGQGTAVIACCCRYSALPTFKGGLALFIQKHWSRGQSKVRVAYCTCYLCGFLDDSMDRGKGHDFFYSFNNNLVPI